MLPMASSTMPIKSSEVECGLAQNIPTMQAMVPRVVTESSVFFFPVRSAHCPMVGAISATTRPASESPQATRVLACGPKLEAAVR